MIPGHPSRRASRSTAMPDPRMQSRKPAVVRWNRPPGMRPLVMVLIAAAAVLHGCSGARTGPTPPPSGAPAFLLGDFDDDYGIRYEITDSVWAQLPQSRYVIERWDRRGFAIARNHADNVEDGGLWTRIDWVRLEDMNPWEWGFCLTIWDAASPVLAEQATTADRLDPRTGCNGFPFSRMKRSGDRGR